jgi:hypothetical protein
VSRELVSAFQRISCSNRLRQGMVTVRAALFCCALTLLSSVPAVSQVTLESLDKRMRTLEAHFDQMFLLLQRLEAIEEMRRTEPPPERTSSPMAAPVATRIQWGYVRREVYSLSLTKAQILRIKQSPWSLPIETPTAPFSSLTVPAAQPFNYGSFLDNWSVVEIGSPDDLIQVVWSGVLRVELKDTLFQLILRNEAGPMPISCRAAVKFDNGRVLQATTHNPRREAELKINTDHDWLDLAPGDVRFSIFLSCLRNRSDELRRVSLFISEGINGKASLRPISEDRFGVSP